LWRIKFYCVVQCSLLPTVNFEYLSLVVSHYVPYPHIYWIPPNIYLEEFSFDAPCYDSYSLRFILCTSIYFCHVMVHNLPGIFWEPQCLFHAIFLRNSGIFCGFELNFVIIWPLISSEILYVPQYFCVMHRPLLPSVYRDKLRFVVSCLVLTLSVILSRIQLNFVTIWSLILPVHCKYLSLFVSRYGPYSLRYILRTSVYLCHAIVLTSSGIMCGIQINFVIIWSLYPPVHCNYFSLVVSC